MALKSRRYASAQALVEYGLVLILVVVVVIAALSFVGPSVSGVFENIIAQLDVGSASIPAVARQFTGRIADFYDTHGHWPRSWGDYRYTDIGLNPDDWAEPVNGIRWNPNGDKVGLSNVPGDNRQVYVDGVDGETRHVYDGYNVWCTATDDKCYYHSVAPENEVDINTLRVVEE